VWCVVCMVLYGFCVWFVFCVCEVCVHVVCVCVCVCKLANARIVK